jgi:adenylyltransferase/sulfurtransferase
MAQPPDAPGWTAQDVSRYSRHLRLPEVGVAGQQRLAAARVLVVGAGGLGSPALLYLAAAGVGTIGVVDDDAVELSNLQRQVLHGSADVGRSKVESAGEALARLNPGVRVVRHLERVTDASAPALVRGYDVVVDGSDNFPTRYAVGAACAEPGIPHVWAAVLGFHGQVSVWWAGHGPCYRCVFPDSPAPGDVPSCAEAGVLGALCGVLGSVQAVEVLKLILGVGDPLVGRLLVHDALSQTWDTVTVRRNPACPVCATFGAAPGLPPPVATGAVPAAAGLTLTAAALAVELVGPCPPLLVDVRSDAERAVGTLPAALAVPLEAFRDGTAYQGSLLGPSDGRAVLYCRSGARSAEAALLARAAGWTGALSLAGGALAWARDVDPDLTVS